MKTGLAPIVDRNSKLIILGSLPGELSLQKQEYYAHPQNQFWRIMSEILGEEFSNDYAQRCQMLLKHNIALWDAIYSAEREGSLDADIKNPKINDFASFFTTFPKIKKVVLNGNKAAKTFQKHYTKIETVIVPSTSPAHANLTYEQKLQAWRQAVII